MKGRMSGRIRGRTHNLEPAADCWSSAISISEIARGPDRQAFTLANPYWASNGLGAVEKKEARNVSSIPAILGTPQHQVHKIASWEPALLVRRLLSHLTKASPLPD
jgi:hypothetical protein